MRRIRPDDGVIDEIAIARACRGEFLPLTHAELRLAVLDLANRGATITRIARTLHISGTTARHIYDQVTTTTNEEQKVA
jgi:DNA-binding NarL/FixJ family response regulator